MTQQFETAFARLNPAQKQAVENIEGPVMVLAGPGTGKTQVLVTRIAHILRETDTKPNSILALTFTESAAQNMRERLVGLIGQTGYSVRISTFHAFCSELINQQPEYFPIDRGSEPITELEQYDLLRQLVVQLKLKKLQPIGDPYFYIRDSIKAISDIKREGVTVEQFTALVEKEQKLFSEQLAEASTLTPKERRAAGLPTVTDLKRSLHLAEKNLELATLYQAYEKALRSAKRYDFDDMIGLTIVALKEHELLRAELQENLQYFLVDEYQDTNAAQDQILQLLSEFWGEMANVFVVGDPNQAIFRFQGASVENMLGFLKRFPEALVVTLTDGYRCPQPLYTAAASLISQNSLTQSSVLDLDVTLHAAKKPLPEDPVAIRLAEFPSDTLELWWVADEIQKLITAGVMPESIAIIYRHNRDRVPLIEALSKRQIGFEIDGGGDALSEETVQQFLRLLRVILDLKTTGTGTELLQVMLYEWFGLPRLSVMQLARIANQKRVSILELLEQTTPELATPEFAAIQSRYQQLLSWASADGDLTLPEWFERVLSESGFLDWLKSLPDQVYQLTVMNSVFGKVKAMVAVAHQKTLQDFLTAVETMQEHHLAITVDDLNLRASQVRLTTAHRAKGQEWDYVFILHCTDKKWSNTVEKKQFQLPASLLQHTNLALKSANEDERRLFYVALTRAKLQVICSYPLSFLKAGKSKPALASQFLTESFAEPADAVLEPSKPTEKLTQADLALALEKNLKPIPAARNVSAEKDFFAALVKNYKLSPTGLSKYLRDPQAFVLEDLLRVPRAKAPPMAYGTAIHVTLEKAYRQFQAAGALPKLTKILADFEEALSAEILSQAEFERRLEHGSIALERYFTVYADETPQPLMLERAFGSGATQTVLGDIKLSGRIDRVDWISQKDRTVRVVDYKTGKPKSENEINGVVATDEFSERELALPATIRGPYQRQLVFYKLLSELDSQFPYVVEEGMFDFIEPKDPDSKLVRRILPITQEAVSDLKQLIKEVTAELRSLKFVEEW